jgi:type VI secretion system protein VasD
MIDRRSILMGGGAVALLALAGCGGPPPEAPPGPGSVTVAATAAAGANPGPDGAGRPLTLTLLQLRAPGAFAAADFYALQSPAGALGADLVSATQVVLGPGGSGSATLALDPGTTAIGVVAGFRDPSGKVFRATIPVAPTDVFTLNVSVGASGVTAARA